MGIVCTFLLYILIVFGTSYSVKRLVKKQNRTKYLGLVIIAAITSFISAMRGTLGTDTQMYIDVYRAGTDSIGRWVEFEPGFKFVVNLFNRIGFSYQVFFFSIGFITVLFAFLAINYERKKINVFLATFLCMIDFYFLSWNVIRQALAISLSIFGLCVFLDKKWVKGTIFIFIASLFHTSALVCLGVIAANYLFETKRYKVFLTIATIIAFYLVFNREIIANIVYSLTHEAYYALYFSRNAKTEGGMLTYFTKLTPILLATILGYKSYDEEPKYKVLFSLMILGYIFSSIGAVTDTQIQRIGYYYTYLMWFVIGRVGKCGILIKRKKILSGNQVMLLMVSFEILLFIFNRFVKEYGDIVPYAWFDI